MPLNAPTDDNLSSICVPIGRFTVPETVEDLRVLLHCIDATTGHATRQKLANEVISFRTMHQQMEAEEKRLSCAPSDQLLDGNTRYNATMVIRAITDAEEDALHASERRVAIIRQEPKSWMYEFMKQLASSAALH